MGLLCERRSITHGSGALEEHGEWKARPLVVQRNVPFDGPAILRRRDLVSERSFRDRKFLRQVDGGTISGVLLEEVESPSIDIVERAVLHTDGTKRLDKRVFTD